MKAEQFIKDYTNGCSNELCAVEDKYGNKVISYHEWLTPDQALRDVEIAKEETIKKLQTKERGTTHLRAKTKEQREHISLVILGDVTTIRCDEIAIYIDDFISYGQMAEIVDYLRKEEQQ